MQNILKWDVRDGRCWWLISIGTRVWPSPLDVLNDGSLAPISSKKSQLLELVPPVLQNTPYMIKYPYLGIAPRLNMQPQSKNIAERL